MKVLVTAVSKEIQENNCRTKERRRKRERKNSSSTML
jgi:hypothetical protein